MSKRLYSQFNTLVLLSLTLGIIYFDRQRVGFSADTYSIPQTTEVTLAWDPNDPAPDGYRIFQRMEGQSYDYSQSCWSGPGNTGTVYNLKLDTTYFLSCGPLTANWKVATLKKCILRRRHRNR
jgi:hypothetical protein